MFSEAILDHFQHPRNAGELPNANVKIKVSNPVCGDLLELAALVEGNVIREVRFLCRGCTASIACASLLTELLRGRELSGIAPLTANAFAAQLGGLPSASFHAARLASDALQALLNAAQKAR